MAIFGSLPLSYFLFTVLHIGCFALAITVCGLYGEDLQRADEAGVGANGRWVFAVVVGGLSALTSAIYCAPIVLRNLGIVGFVWNVIIFALWVAVFGLFGRMYINEDPEGDGGIERMRNAVWVDLANMLLWLIASLAMGAYWWRHRERRSRFTGRAKV
ncbi:hypothetical protein B0I35DRAFT_453799 [Stachybotrys elegans]|uniref:MARVEL domain-containing protein n=1 Tax=Stachybotrys elegans TaxID=80388 RepID=A0A8K0SHT8_9HYPO|nr:hypothetical protein B0I35DRAFT_453799 [Stachybotrys elegans]